MDASKTSLERLLRERDTEISRLQADNNDWDNFEDEDSQLIGVRP